MLTRNQKRMALAVPFALLCLFAAVPTASAEDGVHVYSEEGSYTVTVPADVKVNEASKTGTLEIKGTLDACYNLEIKIASTNGYQVKTAGGSALDYTISDKSIVFSKEAGSNAKDYSYTLNIDVTGTPVVSGTYTDTLTFTMDAKIYTDESTRHTLTFDTACDDAIISTKQKYVTEGEAYGVLPTPQRDRYAFDGWYDSDGVEVDESTIMSTSDTTIYARWTRLYYENKVQVRWENADGTWGNYEEAYSEELKAGETFTWSAETKLLNTDVLKFQWQTPDEISYTTTNEDKTTQVSISRQKYYFDLNGGLEGGHVEGNLRDYGTADVYINGKLAAQGVTDYWKMERYGSTFEIKNINANKGYEYVGTFGDVPLTGTVVGNKPYISSEPMTEGQTMYKTDVNLKFRKLTETTTESSVTDSADTESEEEIDPTISAETTIEAGDDAQ